MRLLAVIEATHITGPAKNLLEFARLARPLGVTVTIAPITRGPASNEFIEAARGGDIPVEVIPERHVFDRRVITVLRELAVGTTPDIIQTHAVKSHFLARLGGLPLIAPWVAFHHGYTRSAARVGFYNQLDRWSLQAARKVITVSAPFRDELVQRGVSSENIEIVHNAIGEDWGRAHRSDPPGLKRSLGIAQDSPVILSVGRLSREKDHLTLLRAASRLNAYLVIVGEGPERMSIQRAIVQLGLQDRVMLTGQKSAAPFYGIAQVVVLSSRSEGSPNVLLEAMASGVPVVATRVGGIPEHVEEGKSALLVGPGDAAAMSAAINSLIGPDRELARQLADRSRELVRERYSPEARVKRLVGIYKSVFQRV